MAAQSARPEGRPDDFAGIHEERRATRSDWLSVGSLACPNCDAPTPLHQTPATPASALACPYCAHSGSVREFLSLRAPYRVPRVNVFVRGLSARVQR